MKILNLGCGNKTSNKSDVINIDWSIYLRLKHNFFVKSFMPLLLRGQRLERYNALPRNVMVHDLKKGLPYVSGSIDVVYHSHLLEHLDRDIAKLFLLEAKRVLKPGGIHRIVVPNFEILCKNYISHITDCENDDTERKNHENFIAKIIEQSVRKEAFGTGQQQSVMRCIENIIFGDARKRGETHQWMYDKISLKVALLDAGYKEILVQKYNTSLIPKWNEYGLDLDEDAGQYKLDSLYIEAIK